ncbi:MAG: phosphopantetheine-binding protein [Desulfobacterales bacterium]|jgi:acyl carrier protein|nr:phosphopantetheine-binding protein [Desulfobacterales bacterium]
MNTIDLKERLKKILVAELDLIDIDPSDIDDDEPLFGEKYGLDSVDAIEIIYQVKENFGVEIRDMKEGRPALQSINSLAAFIEKRSVV